MEISTKGGSNGERFWNMNDFYEFIEDTSNLIFDKNLDGSITSHLLKKTFVFLNLSNIDMFKNSYLSKQEKSNIYFNRYLNSRKLGYDTYFIFENEWIYKRPLLESMIKSRLENSPYKIYARKCESRKITEDEKESGLVKNFCNLNHIQGFASSPISYGLFHEGELVSLLTFTTPRYAPHLYQYELSRFCSKTNHNVIGGATKLFKRFKEDYNPESIISYSNLRYGHGGVYQTLGFKLDGYSQANYFYYKRDNLTTLYSRVNFQKHKLHRLLENFREEQSEQQNMIRHDWCWIYDAGNARWVWRKDEIMEI